MTACIRRKPDGERLDIALSVLFRPADLAEIDLRAEQAGLSRSEAMRRWLRRGLDLEAQRGQ